VDYLTPDFNSAALITIDTQVDTLDGQPLQIPGTSQAVPKISALAAAFRGAGRPTVHIVRLYRRDGSNVDLCRRSDIEAGAQWLLPGSSGSQLPQGIAGDRDFTLDPETLLQGQSQPIGPNEIVIYKPRWGAFYGTPLEDYLQEHEVSTLVFCGCNFPNCPRTSIYEASERDFRIVVAEDALSAFYDKGREELENIGVRMMQTADLIDALAPITASRTAQD
jgi:nicotinamidase-related amidase